MHKIQLVHKTQSSHFKNSLCKKREKRKKGNVFYKDCYKPKLCIQHVQ